MGGEFVGHGLLIIAEVWNLLSRDPWEDMNERLNAPNPIMPLFFADEIFTSRPNILAVIRGSPVSAVLSQQGLAYLFSRPPAPPVSFQPGLACGLSKADTRGTMRRYGDKSVLGVYFGRSTSRCLMG